MTPESAVGEDTPVGAPPSSPGPGASARPEIAAPNHGLVQRTTAGRAKKAGSPS